MHTHIPPWGPTWALWIPTQGSSAPWAQAWGSVASLGSKETHWGPLDVSESGLWSQRRSGSPPLSVGPNSWYQLSIPSQGPARAFGNGGWNPKKGPSRPA